MPGHKGGGVVFRTAFLGVVIGAALLVGAFTLNARRPRVEVDQPSAAAVRATGKCAECHRLETAAVVHEFELSAHAARGITCLDCHQPTANQQSIDHKGFVISQELTSGNCASCHRTQYEQFLRSRHAAPAWAAVRGVQDFTAEQVSFAERYHPGWVDRAANPLALLEGRSAMQSGCLACHEVGKPNTDGSIGTCTDCHARHASSIELARLPATCGQCHLGPDHSQIEIYQASKHGVLFNAQRSLLNLKADPDTLSTADMFVPTCSTCHMSGLDGLNFTHDTTERLSWWLFSAISERRPTADQGETRMKELCLKCHTQPTVDRFYLEANQVVLDTNSKFKEASQLMEALKSEGHLSPEPFDQPIDFVYFDMWHYSGRTAKHGAFMGGADFVQWHGNYELLRKMVELREMARQLRSQGTDGGR